MTDNPALEPKPFEPSFSQKQLLKDLIDYPDDYQPANLRWLDKSTLEDLAILAHHGLIEPIQAHPAEPCTVADLFEVKNDLDATPEQIESTDLFIKKCDEYLSQFVKPVFNDRKERVCHNCGDVLLGLMAGLTARGGGFTWGLTHGEGFCGTCGWPMRAHHRPKDPEATEETPADENWLFSLNSFPLAYMPQPLQTPSNPEGTNDAVSD